MLSSCPPGLLRCINGFWARAFERAALDAFAPAEYANYFTAAGYETGMIGIRSRAC